MSFTKLTDRLKIAAGQAGYIPPVLAGPMLRKVTPESVTVWLALRTSGVVTLTVSTAVGVFVMDGQRKTVAVGTSLHIVAVTAQLKPGGTAMTESAVYKYDLSFDLDGAVSGPMNLADATANAQLAYPPYNSPTFCLPPRDLNALRLICGSCRKASGDGKDHLALLDDLIAQAALEKNPLVRPHQLLLMGDQIYADDVAEGLLMMLTDAGDTLLGWIEKLTSPYNVQFRSADLPPYTRWQTLDDCDFTSEDLRNHLMSLGEYLAMYLFVWSDVLWPKAGDPLPSPDEIKGGVSAWLPTVPVKESDAVWKSYLSEGEDRVKLSNNNLTELRTSLPSVRRVLANIPTYTICDDHEVTDDWNMTLGWWRSLYDFSLGVRIIQNGVLAYTLCQHWGNAPEQFDGSLTTVQGAKLLTLLDKGDAAAYDTNSAPIRSIISVHTQAEIFKQTPPAFFHEPLALTYNYTIEGPGHQIIVTDTRTWRSFPNGGNVHSDLLPPDQLKAQIVNTPPLRTLANVDRILIVVLTTNAPTIEALRAFTRHDLVANAAKRSPDVYESWEVLTLPYDRLLKTLTDKLPLNKKQQLAGSVIILSGDVHHSFASRLVYDAAQRFEDDPLQPKPALAFFAQLVASSLKKQTDDTLDIHKKGYNFNPTHLYTPPLVQEGYVGWNVPVNGPAQVVASGIQKDGKNVRSDIAVAYKNPTLIYTPEIEDAPLAFQLKKTPDYRYRLEYLSQTSKAEATSSFAPVKAPPLSGGSAAARAAAIRSYKSAMDHLVAYHGDGAGGGQCVGANNLCEVAFQWGAGAEKYVIHKVRWWWTDKKTTAPKVLEAAYKIKLDPAAFPDITPAVTP